MKCARCGNSLQASQSSCLRCGLPVSSSNQNTEHGPDSKSKPKPEHKLKPKATSSRKPPPKKNPPVPYKEHDEWSASKAGWVLGFGIFALLIMLAMLMLDAPQNTSNRGKTRPDRVTQTKPPVVQSRNTYVVQKGFTSSAQRSIAGREGQYQREGKAKVESWRQSQKTTRSSTNTAEKPKPSRLVWGTQSILTSLGYKPGPINGLVSLETTVAVRKFQIDNSLLSIDGVIDQQLYSKALERQLHEASVKQSLVKSRETFSVSDISRKDKRAITKECKKQEKSSASRKKCSIRLMKDIFDNPADYSFTDISRTDKKAIEKKCKQHGEPAHHTKCIKRLLEELRKNPADYSFADISKRDRSAIENECDHLDEPGSKNKCTKLVLENHRIYLADLAKNPADYSFSDISRKDKNAIEKACKHHSEPASNADCIKRLLADLREKSTDYSISGISDKDRMTKEKLEKRCKFAPRTCRRKNLP